MAYYLLIDDEQTGPLEIDEVTALILRGKVSHDTLAWIAGMDDWAPAGEVAELAALLGQPPGQTAGPHMSQPFPPATATGAVGGINRPLDFEVTFGRAFEGFKRQFWASFLVALVYNLISSGILIVVFGAAAVIGMTGEDESVDQTVLQFSLIGLLLMMVVMPILYGGLSLAMLNLVRGAPVHVSQLFAGIPRGVTLVTFWLLYAIGCALGFMFFLLPSLFVAASFMFTPFVIVESQLGPIDAMKTGFRAAVSLGWWRCVLLLAVLLIGILIIGAVSQTLVVGFGSALVGFVATLMVNSVVTVVMAASLAAAYEQARENQDRANAAGAA